MLAAVEHRPGMAPADLLHVLAVLAPLLEEQRHSGSGTLCAQRAEPVGIGRSCARPALATRDHPADAREMPSEIERTQQRLGRQDADLRLDGEDMRCAEV